jgi:putative ABC transport system permease protein
VFYVTGVARNVQNFSLGSPDGPFIYPAASGTGEQGPGALSVLARTTGPSSSIVKEIPAVVLSVAPDVVVRVETIEQRLAQVALPTRLAGLLATIFGLLALAMAFVGVYGVVSYGVSQRTREIGVRLALGATGREAVALVMGQGARVSAGGIAAGLFLAAGASQLLGSMLLGLPPLDPPAFLGVAAVLLAAALLALYSPARKAARVDPALTLRQE